MEEQEQPTNIVPIQFKTEKGDLLEKIKPEAVIEEIRRKLLGQERVGGKWVTLPHLKDVALSEVGAWQISTLILSAANQIISISNLNKEEIRARLFNISKTAQKMCNDRWKEFGIKSRSQLAFVHQIIFTSIMASLKQPENEGIRNMIKNIGTADFSYTPEQPKGINLYRK